MEILFNQDGSLAYYRPSGYIQQGNNNVDEIKVAIKGLQVSEWECIAHFLLPNGDSTVNTVSDDAQVYSVDENGVVSYVAGKSFYLTTAETLYAGKVLMSLQFLKLNKSLFTYNTPLYINHAAFDPDTVNITYTEYENLVKAFNQRCGDPFENLETVYVEADDFYQDEPNFEKDLQQYKGKIVRVDFSHLTLDDFYDNGSTWIGMNFLLSKDIGSCLFYSWVLNCELDGFDFEGTNYNRVVIAIMYGDIENFLETVHYIYFDLTSPQAKISVVSVDN